jgi:hypothetical protein
MYKKFHTFWIEFQRLVSDSELYDEETLLKDLKNKMFWDLQKMLASDIYKTIDLYEFVELCQYTNQTFRDVKSKFRNTNRDEYESASRDNFSNQNSSREQSNVSDSWFRSETSKSNSNNQRLNNREMSQVLVLNQVNAFTCYNCDQLDHIACNCKVFRKMNSNSYVREIKKNTLENVESRKD